MAITVLYSFLREYLRDPSTGARFPGIEVVLHGPGGSDRTLAQIDTGAEYCFFSGDRAQGLGIRLLDGTHIRLLSANGGAVDAYLHDLGLEFLGQRVTAKVAFSTGAVTREILGRRGFLDHIQLGVRETHQTVLIEPKP
jgi:predicted aspartyl protease